MELLDLFSGIGGFSLGLERAGFKTVAFCEIDEFPRLVLNKHWPDVPIAGDITQLTYQNGTLYDNGKEIYKGSIRAICGGYPCQPFSVAGKQLAEDDHRNLWPHYLRLIREVWPEYVILENVTGHIGLGLDTVLSDLEGSGYAWEAFVIPACACDGYHRRDRIWVVGYTKGQRVQGFWASGQQEPHSHAEQGLPLRPGERPRDTGWQAEPRLGGGADGFSSRLDRYQSIGDPDATGYPRVTTSTDGRAARIKALGNAVVPQIPEILGHAIMAYDETTNMDSL